MPRGRKRKEEIPSEAGGDEAVEVKEGDTVEKSAAKKRKDPDSKLTFKIEHCKS